MVADQKPLLFRRTYDETLDLIIEARNYFAFVKQRKGDLAAGLLALQRTCEEWRVTTRLTEAMAWLMLQRAIHEGEVTPEVACMPENRISGQQVCLDARPSEQEALPVGLRKLLDRSLSLYERVCRLEQMTLMRHDMASEELRVGIFM